MAIVDQLRKKDRLYHDNAKQCGKTIMRAAALQGRQCGLRDPISAAERVAELYEVHSKPQDWRHFGDIAFHLIATWPADLAYMIIYAMREIKPALAYDPVPFIMKAVEMLPHLRCEAVTLHLEGGERTHKVIVDVDERSIACAKILVREISSVPLRHASGIYNALDKEIKPFVAAQLKEFNKNAATILLKSDWSWLLTGTGLLRMLQKVWRFIHRILFGKMK
ncbi:hypothetical protein HY990_00270 [Candidatus Micrarchaeota archaeon]|nr:hypothetical protein [Candidatus Micrarchaeota archaeon]